MLAQLKWSRVVLCQFSVHRETRSGASTTPLVPGAASLYGRRGANCCAATHCAIKQYTTAAARQMASCMFRDDCMMMKFGTVSTDLKMPHRSDHRSVPLHVQTHAARCRQEQSCQ